MLQFKGVSTSWTFAPFLFYIVVKCVVVEIAVGMVAHVMTFEVGSVLEDPEWQAPVYCFTEAVEETKPVLDTLGGPVSRASLMKGGKLMSM